MNFPRVVTLRRPEAGVSEEEGRASPNEAIRTARRDGEGAEGNYDR